MTALCSECGFTNLYQQTTGVICVNSRQESRQRTNRGAHGLTKEEADNYKALVGCCEICGSEKHLRVDHSHSTGKLRGVLCQRCNAVLHILENPELLEKAQEYLEGYK